MLQGCSQRHFIIYDGSDSEPTQGLTPAAFPAISRPVTLMAFPLQKLLKALLFSSQQPLSIRDLQATFARFHEEPLLARASSEPAGAGAASADAAAPEKEAEETVNEIDSDELHRDVPSLVTATQIREAFDLIAVELRASDDGLLLIETPAGYRLVTHPRFARWIRLLRQEPPPARLSASSLETLAVVAYRQPVTRHEIESIRGVSAEAGLTKLIERELIHVAGRAEQPGRPLQYATTEKFLEFVGVKSLDELPASDVLTSRQIDEWLRQSTNPQKPGDTDMGLPEEQPPPPEAAHQPG
jgi:segregation and condensation protein B